jgi:glucoamylase
VNKLSFTKSLMALSLTLGFATLSGCNQEQSRTTNTPQAEQLSAPGAPGAASTWAYSGKTGVGTSYEMYQGKGYSDQADTGTVSKVWFSLAQGIITETMFGMIHEAQLKELQFIIKGDGFVDTEKDDTISTIEYLHTDDSGRPLSLAYKIVNKAKNGQYEIEKHIFTDPDQQSLFVRAYFRSKKGSITPYLYANPHANNRGSNDSGSVTPEALNANDGEHHLSIKTSEDFAQASVGFIGSSDGLTDLKNNGEMNWQYQNTGTAKGNIALTAAFAPVDGEQIIDLVVGFGSRQTKPQMPV